MNEYRYTECGLDNVVIHGIDVAGDEAGEEVYSIPNILGLHKVIAHGIVTLGQGIRGNELRFLRTEMGLTQGELAELVKRDHQTVGRWERGEISLDPNAEFVIRTVAAERLGIDLGLSHEEMARRCVPGGKLVVIRIDATDPGDYKLAA